MFIKIIGNVEPGNLTPVFSWLRLEVRKAYINSQRDAEPKEYSLSGLGAAVKIVVSAAPKLQEPAKYPAKEPAKELKKGKS